MSVIVIVDDRVTNRNILAKLASLLDETTVVETFEDPREALKWVSKNTPDLVITDYQMPSMDGAEFMARLRQQPLCGDVPAIVVTVYEDRDFRYRALEAGATDFLLSPLDHHEFLARAHNLLNLRKHQHIIRKRALTLEQKLKLANRLRKEELRGSEEKLRLLINAVPAMVCATDAAGLCVFINDYQAVFFGIDPGDAVGAPFVDLFAGDYGQHHRDLDMEVLATGRTLTGIEESLTDQNGNERAYLTTKSALTHISGRVANVVTVSLDITDRKGAEKEVLRAKELAEYANRSKTEFLANMSHELRTPLNAITGFAEVMKVEMLGPIGNYKYRNYAEDILASGQHLLKIIDDMLDVSRIESGKLELVETDVDLEQVMHDVGRLVSGRAADAEVEVIVKLKKNLPLLRADETRLKQILVNLVSNGVKFTPAGGKVQMSASTTQRGAVRIEVSDTGIGIAEKDFPKVLSLFGRVEDSAKRQNPGTGLGLPLSLDLAKLHGGIMDITSTAGKGTTVSIRFPPERSIRQAKQI